MSPNLTKFCFTLPLVTLSFLFGVLATLEEKHLRIGDPALQRVFPQFLGVAHQKLNFLI